MGHRLLSRLSIHLETVRGAVFRYQTCPRLGAEDVPLAEGETARDLPRLALGGRSAATADDVGQEAGAISQRGQLLAEADSVPGLFSVPNQPPSHRQRGDRGGGQDGVHATAETVGDDLETGGGSVDRGPARDPTERGLAGGVSVVLSSTASRLALGIISFAPIA